MSRRPRGSSRHLRPSSEVRPAAFRVCSADLPVLDRAEQERPLVAVEVGRRESARIVGALRIDRDPSGPVVVGWCLVLPRDPHLGLAQRAWKRPVARRDGRHLSPTHPHMLPRQHPPATRVVAVTRPMASCFAGRRSASLRTGSVHHIAAYETWDRKTLDMISPPARGGHRGKALRRIRTASTGRCGTGHTNPCRSDYNDVA